MRLLHRRRRDLQPWLDYFGMLQEYERNGLLNVLPEKHEALVTRAALLTLAGVEVKAGDGTPWVDKANAWRQAGRTVRRLRTYAGWRCQHGGDYLSYPFSVHVVGDDEPHDMISTVVLTSRRRWWRLWTKHDTFEVIGY